jgi:MFS family permease
VWFEPKKLAILVGITQALGMIGGSLGSLLVPHLKDNIGWRDTYYVYAVFFLILAVLIFAFVRNQPKDNVKQQDSMPEKPQGSIKEVLLNKYTWINAFYAGFIFAPTDVMGELWGREFLSKIHDISGNTASMAISLLLLGWAIGGPLAGSLANYIGRKPVMILTSILGLILLPLIFQTTGLPLYITMILLFTYGFTNTGLVASYATAGELHEKGHAGFSMAIANMLSVLLGAMLMPLLAKILEWQASSHIVDGLVTFTSAEYQKATLALPVCMICALFLALISKETLKKR